MLNILKFLKNTIAEEVQMAIDPTTGYDVPPVASLDLTSTATLLEAAKESVAQTATAEISKVADSASVVSESLGYLSTLKALVVKANVDVTAIWDDAVEVADVIHTGREVAEDYASTLGSVLHIGGAPVASVWDKLVAFAKKHA